MEEQGQKRIDNENKELKTGHYGGGRPRKNPMTPEEIIASQRKQIERLEAEKDFLRQKLHLHHFQPIIL